MATTGALSRHLHFAELNEPLQTSSGWMTPEQRKAAARDNLGVTGSGETAASDVSVAAGTDGLDAGTVQEALQALATRVAALEPEA